MEGTTKRTPPAAPGYEFLQPLAVGGTSTVWLARQVSLDRTVAVKVLDASLLADEAERARFREEARAAARLDVPSIVRVVDFGEVGGELYYVMEYVEGTSLAEWLLANGRMAAEPALQVTEIVAAAMAAAWEKTGLVHGDIKPGNVLVGTDGAVKLTDLGLSRLSARFTSAGPAALTAELEGTPTYLAPEQVGGEPATVQSDVYSLGLTLYHLVTGKVPFDGRSLADLLAAQVDDFLPDPCDLVGDSLPVGVAWLLAKMTAKEPARRPDWTALLADLRRLRAGDVPAGPFPGDAESTVMLSAAHQPGMRAAVRVAASSGGRSVAVSVASRNGFRMPASSGPSVRAQMRGASGGGFGKFLGFLLFLLVVAAGVWFFVFRSHPERVVELKKMFSGDASATPAASAPSERPVPPVPAASAETAPAAAPEAAPDRHEVVPLPSPTAARGRGTDVEGAWADPRYVEAAKRFNTALERYQAARADQVGPTDPVWGEIGREAAEAATALDRLRPGAPSGVPLRDYANMACQLAKDARLAARTEEEKRADWTRAPKRRHPGAAPWPSPERAEGDAFAFGRMQLGYAWDVLPAPRSTLGVEWLTMVSAQATAAPNTSGDMSMPLIGALRFLMDAQEAAQRLEQPLPVRELAKSDLFPFGGVFAYRGLDPKAYGNIRRPAPRYRKLDLLADADDQLVGLYFHDDDPVALAHPEEAFSTVSRIADFVEGSELPADGNLRACHQFMLGEGTARIDSETADFSAAPPRPVRQSTFILPKGFLDCLYYHAIGAAD